MNIMKNILVSSAVIFIGLILLPVAICFAEALKPKSFSEMDKIVASKDMSAEEKISKLCEFLTRERWNLVLYQIDRIDKTKAKNIAFNLFRDKSATRENKLEVGRFILQRYDVNEFIDEYSRFLVDAVLNGGLEEFCVKREEHKVSAVGEYSFIASDFEGFSSTYFSKIKDNRVIPVLVKCLDAPDEIYGESSGCVVIPVKPGEFTGRNIARQQIPVALAELNAVDAIDKLISIVKTHHDYRLKYNSAYALAVLMDRKDSITIEDFLKKDDEFNLLLFPFGRGLIKKGRDEGVKYMDFRYSTYYKDGSLSAVLYMAEERFPILKNIKSKELQSLYKKMFEYKPLYNILLFDNTKVKDKSAKLYIQNSDKLSEAELIKEALKSQKDRIIALYTNIINSLIANEINKFSSIISDIAKHSKSPEIRKISNKYLSVIEEKD